MANPGANQVLSREPSRQAAVPRASFSCRPFAGAVALALLALLLALPGRATPPRASLELAVALFDQNKLTEALPLLEQVTARDPCDARAQAWLADTYRRLGRRDEAIRAARLALEDDSCSSFAHVVLAAVYAPGAAVVPTSVSDSTWLHLLRAVECDSTDGNAWEFVALESIRRGEPETRRRSLRLLVESGHLTPAALSFGRWLLRTLPRNAILLTNGDLDTYPTMALQQVEGLRPDVVVAERGLIGAPWILRYLRDRAGVPLPYEDWQLDTLSVLVDEQGKRLRVSDRVLRGWQERQTRGAFDRPICLAATLDESFLAGMKGHLRDAGPFLVWRPEAVGDTPDTAAMRASLGGIREDEFVGPWAGPRDRSPVHRVYSKRVARTVTGTALTYAEWLIRAGRIAEGERVLDWADRFEARTELGPSFTSEIAELRAAANRGKPKR